MHMTRSRHHPSPLASPVFLPTPAAVSHCRVEIDERAEIFLYTVILVFVFSNIANHEFQETDGWGMMYDGLINESSSDGVQWDRELAATASLIVGVPGLHCMIHGWLWPILMPLYMPSPAPLLMSAYTMALVSCTFCLFFSNGNH